MTKGSRLLPERSLLGTDQDQAFGTSVTRKRQDRVGPMVLPPTGVVFVLSSLTGCMQHACMGWA